MSEHENHQDVNDAYSRNADLDDGFQNRKFENLAQQMYRGNENLRLSIYVRLGK